VNGVFKKILQNQLNAGMKILSGKKPNLPRICADERRIWHDSVHFSNQKFIAQNPNIMLFSGSGSEMIGAMQAGWEDVTV
jgi:hypothetical protein